MKQPPFSPSPISTTTSSGTQLKKQIPSNQINTMKTQSYSQSLLLMAGTMALACAASNAATVAYAGSQLNVDAKQTSLPAVADSIGWRNATTAKPLDVDGDNIIGTDGYTGRASNVAPSVIPSYLTFSSITGGGNSFGYFDNPLDPTGIDTARVGFQGTTATSADFFRLTIVGTSLETQVLGLAIQFDTYNGGAGQNQTFTLTQTVGTVGGTGPKTSDPLMILNNGYDWAFFEITGATAGDQFVLSATKGAVGPQYLQYGQVAFDTAPVPEPSTTALLGLGGLALILRRRI